MSPPARRVLMLTAAWPPVARVGGRRPLRLARRLGALGWDPVVLTPEPAAVFRAMPRLDHSLIEPSVEVHRVGRTVPSTALHRLLGRLPGSQITRRLLADALLPDQYIEWMPSALAAARRLGPIDAVWATGPPFGMHAVGAALARGLQAPLVLDYRDPWTVAEVGRRSPIAPPARALRALEGWLLGQAAAVVYVADDIRARNRAAFGERGGPGQVIPNGFDPLDVGPVTALRPLRPTLVYAGSCYGSRTMLPVLEALAEGFGPGDRGLRLQVFGELDPAAQGFLAGHPLGGRVQLERRVDAAVLAGHLRGADGLLLLVGETHHTVPAKLFDYLEAGRPVLGVGAADCAAAGVVRACGVGRWCADRPALIAGLRQIERRALPFAPVPSEIRRYSADAMAEAVARVLDVAIGRAGD